MDLRIGILECDHVDPDLRDQYGDYHEMFADLVHAQDNSIEFSVYDLVDLVFTKTFLGSIKLKIL